jgi:hypothetical protein
VVIIVFFLSVGGCLRLGLDRLPGSLHGGADSDIELVDSDQRDDADIEDSDIDKHHNEDADEPDVDSSDGEEALDEPDSDECIGSVHELDWLEAMNDSPGLRAYSYEGDPCNHLQVEVLGDPVDGFPATDDVSCGHGSLHLTSSGSSSSTLMFGFARPVRDVSFDFLWLSYNPPSNYDERLSFAVDDAAVEPVLSEVVSVSWNGSEVVSSAARGDAHVDLPGIGQSFSITLRNADAGDGIGSCINHITYTTE